MSVTLLRPYDSFTAGSIVSLGAELEASLIQQSIAVAAPVHVITSSTVSLQHGVPVAADFPSAGGFVIDVDTGIAYYSTTGTAVAVGSNPFGTVTNIDNTSQVLVDGATVAWDMNSGVIGTLTLGGNRTMAAPTNLKHGTVILHVIQDGVGSRTITWNSVFKWTGGSAPALTTTAAAHDVVTGVSDGTNIYCNIMPDVR